MRTLRREWDVGFAANQKTCTFSNSRWWKQDSEQLVRDAVGRRGVMLREVKN